MTNNQKYYFYYAFWAVILLFTSGGMIQTLFSEAGFSLQQISTYSAVLSTVQMTVTLINVFLSDRIRNVKKATALLALAPILLYTAVLPICFGEDIPSRMMFLIICGAGGLTGLLLGIQNIFIYRLNYSTVDMSNYTDFSSKVTICGGICSIGTGLFITALSAFRPFRRIAAITLILCILFSVSCCLLAGSMKEHPVKSRRGPQSSFSPADFSLPYFKWFYLPNFLRGLGMGVMNSISVICIKEITDDASFVSGLVTLLAASAVAGSLLCNLCKKKFTATGQYVYASLGMAILLPLSVMCKAPVWFAVLLFLTGCMYNVIAVIAAVHAAEVADYSNIGMYTSVRMICMYAGQAVAGALISICIAHVSGMVLLFAGGICQALSALFYHLYEKKYLSCNPSRGSV